MIPNSISYCNFIKSKKHKRLKQLESAFKRTINWNKYLAKTTNQARNRYFDYPVNSSFQGVNGLFILAFEDDNGQESLQQYYLPTVEIKNHMIILERPQQVKVVITQLDAY